MPDRRLLAQIVAAAVAALAGGLLTNAAGLIVASLAVGVVGLLRAGPAGVSIVALVFGSSVSVSHYGFGAAEWTQAEDRIWVALWCGVSLVALLAAVRDRRLYAPLGVVTILAMSTVSLVDAPATVRVLSGLIVVVLGAHAIVLLSGLGRRIGIDAGVVRVAVDMTIGVGVVLDVFNDTIGGFGGRGPERFGIERWIGTTLDPNELGELGLLGLGLTFVLWHARKERAATALPRAALYAVVVGATGSRTSMGLVIVLFVGVALAVAPRRLQVAGAAAVAVALVGVVAFWSSIEPRITGFEEIDNLSTLNGRTEIWELALEERFDRPIEAWGFGRTEEYFRELHATSQPIPWFNISTHNRVLEAWAALGLHVAVALIAVWCAVLFAARSVGAVSVVVAVVAIGSSMMVPGFTSIRPGAWWLVPLVLAASAGGVWSDDGDET